MIQVAIIPADHTGNLFSFLMPLVNELRTLEDGGMTVYCSNGSFHVNVHLIIGSGDIIGVAELANHSGHGSRFGCRQCRIETIREISPKGAGHGHYYHGGPRTGMPAERTDDEFKIGNLVSLN